jgi:aldose 1-epimerase
VRTLARSAFQATLDGLPTDLYTLDGAGGLQVAICNHGARLVQLALPDGQGGRADLVLGCDSLGGYLDSQPSMGAFIGRWAGRLGQGRLRLPDGTLRQLPCNGGAHALHGGPRGSRHRVFQVDEVHTDALQLSLVFRPEDDGVPGSLRLRLRYQLLPDNSLQLRWQATAGGQATLAQFTPHPFFNLAGQGCALDHVLQIPARQVLPLAADLCPQGPPLPVAGSPLDFQAPRSLQQALAQPHAQWQLAGGIDHFFVLDQSAPAPGPPALAAQLHCWHSGRHLQVWSSEPGVQVYGGQGLTGPGWAPSDGLCLEPMSWPDAANQPAFPNPWLAPGATRHGEVLYRFT